MDSCPFYVAWYDSYFFGGYDCNYYTFLLTFDSLKCSLEQVADKPKSPLLNYSKNIIKISNFSYSTLLVNKLL